jgi:hypothetical protein
MRHTIMALAVAIAAVGTAQAEDKQLLWGDTHLHTTYSSDAFANNNLTAGPETAYRYAKGIPVVHPGHKARVQIETPLDFLVVSDHAEFMGVIRHTFYEGVDTEGLGVIDRIGAWIAEWVLRGGNRKGGGARTVCRRVTRARR